MSSRLVRNSVLLVVLAVFGLALLWTYMLGGGSETSYTYSDLLTEVSTTAGVEKIESITMDGDRLIVKRTGEENPVTAIVPPGSQGTAIFDQLCSAAGLANPAVCATSLKFNPIEPSAAGSIITLLITALLPVLLIGAFIFFMMRQAQGTNNQAMSFGKSRARMFLGNKTVVTFNDVAGVDEAKQELTEVVEFLKYPEKFNSLGARIPRGVLLVGPPGTGKTLLARAVAGEAGVPFFSISGSEFVEMFVGVGASRVRDLFEQAKRNSPCIVFVDEIDAVGRQRGAGLGGSHDEREQTLNQILVEMDGFDTNTNVIVVAATNRPDVLDPALLRPGRFDRQVVLDRPDIRGRKEILSVHIKGKPLDKTVNIEALARRSPGFSGADLANLVNEAAILAARRNKKSIGADEFNEAIDRVIAGPERRSRLITEEEKGIIAIHEGGHAVVQRVLPKCDPVTKVTIVSRGMALGYTMSLPQEDRYLHSKSEFEDKIAGMLGGNVAEMLVFGDTTTGSSNDIEKATNLARAMVTQYGMSEKLGPLTFGRKEEMIFLGREISEQRNYSDEVAAKIDAEVREIIDRAYERAKEALIAQRAVLDRLAALLVEKETIEHDEFESLFEGILPPRSSGPAPRPAEEEAPSGGDVETEPSGDEPPTKRRRGPAPQPA
ncbi:MAG TPA: ATP-dependent zinc metalloprotease FtsH [Candidatus Limnocylindria bacterium]|nr:ATP-dependent zinc metalloprotease FtsH [Candidatus Limnocylindria bacterium]